MTPITDAERLFGLILPRDGYRACAVQWQPKDQEFTALYNRLFETDAELARWLIAKGTRGNVWFATATFMAISEPAQSGGFKGRRDESNIHSRQCFHGDIDCGEDRPYPRFDHAQAALGLAVAQLGIPNPIVVRSGHGLHFYWPLKEPVADIRVWRDYAAGLMAALEGQGLKLDAQCSTDAVRLLRPPGTHNHKGGLKLPVCVEEWGSGPAPLSAFDRFKSRVRRSYTSRAGEPPPATRPPLPLENFAVVLRRCRQLNIFARKLGAVSEPEWKSCLGVLAFVENGRAIAHEYSRGDPRYDPVETDRKFDDRARLHGPSTCHQFQTLGNGLCAGCTWRSGSIASPLRLGVLQ